MPTYARPRLITEDDTRYRAHVALVGAENLALDWEQDDREPDDEAEPRPSSSLYATSRPDEASADGSDDSHDNPMVAALRKTGVQ